MDKFVGALQDQELADRTIYHRFACLPSFLKANDVKLVTLKDAPDYVEGAAPTASAAPDICFRKLRLELIVFLRGTISFLF
jgi:hypothetical protein